jgi:hypothetical protein
MMKQVLIRLVIVLSVGWSFFVIWISYSTAPSSDTFRVAWAEPWLPPAEDILIDRPPWERNWSYDEPKPGLVAPGQVRLGDELERASGALRNAQAAGDTQAAEKLANYIAIIRVEAVSQGKAIEAATERRKQAREQVWAYVAFTILLWGIPVAAVWSIVWVAAPLSRVSKPEG